MAELRLAVDNVSALPIVNVADISANLRLLADSIDKGEQAEMRSCVFLIVYDSGLSVHVKGESCTPYELMGLFEAAKLRVFADDADLGDE